MSEDNKDKLTDVYVLMYGAFKGYGDRCYMSNKLFDIMQYRNQLPEDVFGKIKEFADENIKPMIFDADYWSDIIKNDSNGSYIEISVYSGAVRIYSENVSAGWFYRGALPVILS